MRRDRTGGTELGVRGLFVSLKLADPKPWVHCILSVQLHTILFAGPRICFLAKSTAPRSIVGVCCCAWFDVQMIIW